MFDHMRRFMDQCAFKRLDPASRRMLDALAPDLDQPLYEHDEIAQIVGECLQQGANPNSCKPKPVRESRRSGAPALPTISALGYAMESGNAQACRQLLDAGATVGKDVVTGAVNAVKRETQVNGECQQSTVECVELLAQRNLDRDLLAAPHRNNYGELESAKRILAGACPSFLPHVQQAKLEAQTAAAASGRPNHMRL